MPFVVKEDLTLDPFDLGLFGSECCNASLGSLRAPGQAVWAWEFTYFTTESGPVPRFRDAILVRQLNGLINYDSIHS